MLACWAPLLGGGDPPTSVWKYGWLITRPGLRAPAAARHATCGGVIGRSSLVVDEIIIYDCMVNQVRLRNPSVLTELRYDCRTYPYDAAQ